MCLNRMPDSARIARLPNGILWYLFHWNFGWQIMMTLPAITQLLPWMRSGGETRGLELSFTAP